jgi:hypothetical protein
LNCDPACTQCFNSGLNSCTVCKNNGTANFFLQPNSGSTQCSETCPNGYKGSTALTDDYRCEILTICSSTCASCTITDDPYSCTSCSSSLTNGLTYETFSGTGSCIPDISDPNYPNLQLLQIVDSNTNIGTSYLKSVTFNGITNSTNNTNIGSILYNPKLIAFHSLTSPVVTFSFSGIGFDHYKVYVRLSVSSTCSGHNDTLDLTVAGIKQTFTTVSGESVL